MGERNQPDDLAARLRAVDPADVAELVALRDAFQDLAGSDAPLMTKRLAETIEARLSEALDTASPEAAVVAARRLLAAMVIPESPASSKPTKKRRSKRPASRRPRAKKAAAKKKTSKKPSSKQRATSEGETPSTPPKEIVEDKAAADATPPEPASTDAMPVPAKEDDWGLSDSSGAPDDVASDALLPPAGDPVPETATVAEQVAEQAPKPEATVPATSIAIEEDPELLSECIEETGSGLDEAESALLSLEENPEDLQHVDTAFRLFHTIKGIAGFLQLTLVSELAHASESLLTRVRNGVVVFQPGYATLMLRAVDMLRGINNALSAKLAEGSALALSAPHGWAELVSELRAAGTDEEPAVRVESPPPPAPLEAPPPANEPPSDAVDAAPSDAVDAAPEPTPTVAPSPDPAPSPELAATPANDGPKAASTTKNPAPRSDGPTPVKTNADAFLRIRTDRLDRLLDAVGELVIAHAMISDDTSLSAAMDVEVARRVSHAGKIVRELQQMSTSLRMVPLKSMFQKMGRIIRDVAQKSGKQVRLVTVGEDTELDRNLVHMLSDPLIHMVRNAVDHGIEPPEERRAAGKSPIGEVVLAARQEGGHVLVELRDDGKGLDGKKIRAKAISQGIITEDRTLSTQEELQLIFSAGLSTAEQVTEVSGRGIGMDVVRRKIDALKGQITIESEVGKGSSFMMSLPLTLAITDGMIVRVGEHRYIVPTLSIAMSFRPAPGRVTTVSGRGELIRLHGRSIPIIRLHDLFNISGAKRDPCDGLLVALQDTKGYYALLVDELVGQQQVVTKALGDGFHHVPGLSGGAILADGRVGLILDPSAIRKLSMGILAA